MFEFEYKSEEELEKERVPLSEGEGQFVITKAEQSLSKAGNDMLILTLEIWDSSGKKGFMNDYIVATAVWKISALCKAIDKEGLYKQSKFDPSELVGHGGNLDIKHEKDAKGILRPRVAIYLKADKANKETDPFFNEDIPDFK